MHTVDSIDLFSMCIDLRELDTLYTHHNTDYSLSQSPKVKSTLQSLNKILPGDVYVMRLHYIVRDCCV